MSYTEKEWIEYQREQQRQEEHEIEIVAQVAASEIYDEAFRILDTLDIIDGEKAGQIAKAVQELVERELRDAM